MKKNAYNICKIVTAEYVSEDKNEIYLLVVPLKVV